LQEQTLSKNDPQTQARMSFETKVVDGAEIDRRHISGRQAVTFGIPDDFAASSEFGVQMQNMHLA